MDPDTLHALEDAATSYDHANHLLAVAVESVADNYLGGRDAERCLALAKTNLEQSEMWFERAHRLIVTEHS